MTTPSERRRWTGSIASPMTTREKLTGYLDVRGGIAFKAGDLATARTHWTRLLGLKPDDPDVLGNLAQVRVAQGDSRGAADLLERSVAEREQSGQLASAASYRQRLTILQQSGPAGAAAAAAGRWSAPIRPRLIGAKRSSSTASSRRRRERWRSTCFA